MGLNKRAIYGLGWVLVTLVLFNLILYNFIPPAQRTPDTSYAQQARLKAESDGELAGFYDFDTELELGWYPPDYQALDNSTAQYMAQASAPITLDVRCAAPWHIDVVILDHPVRPQTPPIRLKVNDEQATLSVTRGLRRWHYQTVIPEGLAGDWRVEVEVDRLESLNDVISSTDTRPTGAGVDWVLVTSENCPE